MKAVNSSDKIPSAPVRAVHRCSPAVGLGLATHPPTDAE